MQDIASGLALANCPSSDTDLLISIVNQLGDDYRPIVISLSILLAQQILSSDLIRVMIIRSTTVEERMEATPDRKILCQSMANPPVINVAATHLSSEPAYWMFDSGASHHTTMTTTTLQDSFAYDGPDTIQLGNGNSLPISHIC
ncbi:hypothetical protein F3Y22_tig00110745pilonHSYRG00179 [Hibiscus syriacus]|uniref:Uncharacterized protein n=1 Tax=Hibiscus syriacus TaxID=106335 RepID=A0A6A2ZU33_HIBSY|nr:hypothetical protein F3Y22_tig00110745pilonHSYRG00179 [Hibiscus syriacus]